MHLIKDITASAPDSEHVGTLLESAIRDIGIPPCPAILNQINIEMGKDEPDFKRLDHIICSDVSLAAGLIAIANSPFYGLRKRVRSPKEALVMLGLGVAGRTIAGIMLQKVFPPTPELIQFWRTSASIAQLSGWIAKNVDIGVKVRADDAYTFGLFRDCGIPVLMKRFMGYAELLAKAYEEKELAFTEVEQTLCPTNHAAVGCLLAQSWWLPDDISLAIRYHHDYRVFEGDCTYKLPPTTIGLIANAQLAEHLFQYNTGLVQGQEWDKLGKSCLRILNLDEKDLADIYGECSLVITNHE